VQLVMPMAHDQFDNADRVQRLGVGDWLPRQRFKKANVADKLRHLLADAGVAAAARQWAQQLAQAPDGCDAAALALEGLMQPSHGASGVALGAR
jgi:UDP:flavonoid glycosyltransferase YjiC (YdhE family)